MGAINLRRQLLRRRRHLGTLAVLLVLGTAVAVHHGAIASQGMHDHGAMNAAVEMCAGVLTAIGAAVAAAVWGVLALAYRRPLAMLAPSMLALASGRATARSRAGPELLCLLCVSRR